MSLQMVGVGMALAGIAAVAALVMAVIRLLINVTVVATEDQLNFDRSYFVVMVVLCVMAVALVLVTIIGLLGSMSKLVNY